MSKKWKCTECVKHGTDACYNGSRFDDDNCKYVLIDSDYAYQQGRVDAIDECLSIVQKIKDDYNDSKFGEQVPINYGTICGIIISLNRLKEHREV